MVGLTAGLLGGVAGLELGLSPLVVAALAGMVAALGDLGAHLVRRDDQFVAAVTRVRGGDGP